MWSKLYVILAGQKIYAARKTTNFNRLFLIEINFDDIMSNLVTVKNKS